MTRPDAHSAIEIDLTNDKIDFSKGELQSEGGIKLLALIASQLKTADDVSYDRVKATAITYPRTHHAILVEGGRGSGKTTFLLSYLERLSQIGKQEETTSQDLTQIARKVHVLPMVDPTLIEAKDNIIIIIVQMIDAALDDNGGADRLGDDSMRDLDKAREALAEGLSMLDGIGQKEPYGSQWEDAYWVMSEGLRKAQKGRDFERKFNVFLERALNVLGKKAFVLAFDDVDTNFKHGHLILETIRKYLTSPRLILILSGDLDLYGRLIRGHIFETFGEKILKYDAEVTLSGKQAVQIAVRELEEQYLLKIVPPQNRIRMLPLGGLASASKIEVRSDRSSTASSSAALPTWISNRIRAVLCEQGTGKHPFVRVIWREHMRLVLSYLRALDLAVDETSSGRADVRASCSAVLRVFETRLRMADVPADLVDTHNFDEVLRAVFDWLAGQQEPATLARFGTPADPNQAIVLHCLALAIARGLSERGNDLKALLTMALPAIMLKRPILAEVERKRWVFSYLGSQATPLLSETAARISAVDRFQPNHVVARQRPSSFGSVGLAGRDSGSLPRAEAIERVYNYRIDQKKKNTSFADLKTASSKRSSAKWLTIIESQTTNLTPRFGLAWFTIEDLVNNERCGEFATVLNLIFFRRYSQRGEIFRSISALSLLAIIAELLLRDEWAGLEGLSVDAIIPAFGSAEIKITETRSKSSTSDDSSEDERIEADDASEETIETTETGDGQDTSYAAFLDSMKEWREFASRLGSGAPLAPSLLGAVATRLHDDLLDLDGEVPTNWGSGDILHRQITNLLNCVIAETSRGEGRKESPKSSDVPLVNALRRNGKTLHPLAVILLSCPLVWIFLRPTDGDEDNLAGAARNALREWWNASNPDDAPDENFEKWTKAPEIEVKIGTIVKKGEQRMAKVVGFFDLLNVVPRYADEPR